MFALCLSSMWSKSLSLLGQLRLLCFQAPSAFTWLVVFVLFYSLYCNLNIFLIFHIHMRCTLNRVIAVYCDQIRCMLHTFAFEAVVLWDSVPSEKSAIRIAEGTCI